MTTQTPETSSVFADLAPTFGRLRASVKLILDSRPKAVAGARACAREFGFDKSIGWKLFQIGYATDFITALSAMPGARGWEIAFAKFEAAGVPAPKVAEAQWALSVFEKQLADRRIDRSMLSGMAAAVVDTDESRRQMLRLRKQASDAMAVIHGVHCAARVGGFLVMPSKTSGMADLAALTIVEGLERRRPGPPWPLYDPIHSYDAKGAGLAHATSGIGRGAREPIVDDLSSPKVLETEIGSREDRAGAFDFVGRSATRTEALTVSFAEHATAVGPLTKRGNETQCELSMPVTVPTSVAIFDLLIHRSIKRTGPVNAEMFASGVVSRQSRPARDSLRLGLEALVRTPTSLHIPEVSAGTSAAYAELCRRSADRFGFDRADFEVQRIVVPHPPVPCTLQMWWELAGS